MNRTLPTLVGALCALVLPAAASADVEPNDLVHRGEPLTAVPSTVTGVFGQPEDVDHYTLFVGVPGNRVRISVAAAGALCPDSPCPLDVDLIDRRSGYVAEGWDYVGGARRPFDVAFDAALPAAGTHHIRIEGAAGFSTTVPYTLTVDADQPLMSFPPEQCEAARVTHERAQIGLARALRAERRWAAAARARRASARTVARRRLNEARRHIPFHRDRIAAATETLRRNCAEL